MGLQSEIAALEANENPPQKNFIDKRTSPRANDDLSLNTVDEDTSDLNSTNSVSEGPHDDIDFVDAIADHENIHSRAKKDVGDVNQLLKRNCSGSFVKTWSNDEVKLLEGVAVRAPYVEKWGGHTYHNALVMSIGNKETGELDNQCPEVSVYIVN